MLIPNKPPPPRSVDFALTKHQQEWYQLGQEAFWVGYSPKGYLKLNQLSIPAHALYDIYLKGYRDACDEDMTDAN
jgi:hypothetical protein